MFTTLLQRQAMPHPRDIQAFPGPPRPHLPLQYILPVWPGVPLQEEHGEKFPRRGAAVVSVIPVWSCLSCVLAGVGLCDNQQAPWALKGSDCHYPGVRALHRWLSFTL